MLYKVISPDGRVLMHTNALQFVRQDEAKSQKAAGCRLVVEDAAPQELARIEKMGVKVVRR